MAHLPFVKQFTVLNTPPGPGTKTGITLQYFAGLADQFLFFIARERFKSVIHRNDNAIGIHHHKPIQHGLHHGLPVLTIFIFKHFVPHWQKTR